jgi:hypothetical protein
MLLPFVIIPKKPTSGQEFKNLNKQGVGEAIPLGDVSRTEINDICSQCYSSHDDFHALPGYPTPKMTSHPGIQYVLPSLESFPGTMSKTRSPCDHPGGPVSRHPGATRSHTSGSSPSSPIPRSDACKSPHTSPPQPCNIPASRGHWHRASSTHRTGFLHLNPTSSLMPSSSP